ncbi:dipeptide/oligopeptide/nickel ABC transporter permease/ATP-binding protein [Homoserinimonas sp. A520]
MSAKVMDSPASRRAPSRFARRLIRQVETILWAILLVIIITSAILAPILAPFDPTAGDLFRTLEGPSPEHLLGTDGLGRDVLSRLLYGAQVAFASGLQVVVIAVVIGVPVGLIVGYYGGWVDRILMRVVDAVDALPFLVMAIALISIVGPSLTNSMTMVGILFSVPILRLVRGVVLSAREEVYVDAARVIGAPTWKILGRHILPNIMPPLIVQITILAAVAIVVEATLSFLGLGVQSPDSSWGGMLSTAQQYIRQDFFAAFPPGLAIVITVLALNRIGDGIRDAFAREAHGGSLGVHEVDKAPATDASQAPAETGAGSDVLLSVRNLNVKFPTQHGVVDVVSNVCIDIRRGEIMGLVGESGSGKSITAASLVGLVPDPGHARAESISFDGRRLEGLSFEDLRAIRGAGIGVIFQDPLSSLNPVFTVSDQVSEMLREHRPHMTRKEIRARVIELFAQVGIPSPEERLKDYPHQFSGGMAQRVMIAMALACEPQLLIADEPTTALDVTVQGQVLDLLLKLRDELGMSILLITHDLGVVADVADRVTVMYAGEVVESGTSEEVFSAPRHPYTVGLMRAVPRNEKRTGRLDSIPGIVPAPWDWPVGCHFADRCSEARDACRTGAIPLDGDADRQVRCVRWTEITLTPKPTESRRSELTNS